MAAHRPSKALCALHHRLPAPCRRQRGDQADPSEADASAEAPYLSLVAPLDVALLRSLAHELGDHPEADGPASAFLVHPVGAATLAVFERFVAVAHDPTDARVLGPLVRRELHYRLLCGRHGAMLRARVQRTSHASNIARAIETLRQSYRQRLEMDTVARSVGMSASSFYRHFKAVTSTTPLQFQKDLRLTEARRLLQSAGRSTRPSRSATSQCSREYARRFGSPRGRGWTSPGGWWATGAGRPAPAGVGTRRGRVSRTFGAAR